MHQARVGVVCLGIGLAGLSFGQTAKVTLDAIQGGKKVGFIDLTRTVKGSTLTSVNRMSIQQGPGTTKIELTTTVDGAGTVLARAAAIQQGKVAISLSATFTPKAAMMTIAAQGKTDKRTIPALPGLSTSDPSNWWFIKGKPKPGQTITYQTFNMLSAKWQKVESTYAGKKSIKVGSKTVMANEIKEKRAEGTFSVFIDDAGLPYIIDQGKLKFVRRM